MGKTTDDCESMDCKKVKEELVFLYADNEMGREVRVAFKRHVSLCPRCARKAEFTRRLLDLIRERARRREAPRRLRAKILAGLPHRRIIPVR